MPIDKSGKWWRGSDPSDIDEYIAAYSAQSYPASRIVHAACNRDSGAVFRVRIDDTEGYVERTCVGCDTTVVMLDSAEVLK